MIEIIWDFLIKDESKGRFELAFGPGGAWDNLLGGCPGFRGITLLRGTENPRQYLMIELWDSEVHREQMLVDYRTEYANLDADISRWIESKTDMGTFRVMAESTVRPRGKSRRRWGGESQRKRRRPSV